MATPPPTHTGSEFGKYTFHIPNTFSRRPVAVDYEDAESPPNQGLYKPAMAQQDDGQPEHQGQTERDVAARAEEHTAMLSYEEDNGQPGEQQEEWAKHLSLGLGGRAAVLATFSLLGASVLLPWNTIITPTEYYRSLLTNSHVAMTFMSWVLLAYNAATILLGAHAVVSIHKTTPARRIYYSTTFIILCLFIFTISTTQSVTSPSRPIHDVYFAFLLVFTIAVAGSTAYLQNAVVSLCSIFGGRAMGFMLTGQGLIGVGISIVQLIAAHRNKTPPLSGGGSGGEGGDTATPGAPSSDNDAGVSKAASAFFACSTLFMALSFASFICLAKSKVYRATCRGYESATQSRDAEPPLQEASTSVDSSVLFSLVERFPRASRASAHRILGVQAKVFTRAMCLVTNFAVTLSVFPSLTARVTSTSLGDQAWASPLVFIAAHFLTFNVADMVGRMIPTLRGWILRSEKWTVVGAAVRIVFIPLFLACNVGLEGGSFTRVLPDWAFFAVVFLFGLSNGFIATSIMIAGPSSSKLTNDTERALAGAVLSFWLTLGLAAGSIGSFIVTALV